MRRFALGGNKVMFVNSISMGLPSLKSRDLLGKIKRKLASYARLVRKTEEGIIVVTPAVIPFYSSPAARFLNRILLYLQIRFLMLIYGFRRPILWVAIPTACDIAEKLKPKVMVYHVSDKYDSNQMDHATSKEVIRRMHRSLLDRAGLIYYSGRKLFEEALAEYPETRERSRLLEQAVDFQHFSLATANPKPKGPDDITKIAKPRLGYFGAIESWLIDQKLVEYVSNKRPDWQWVFLGLRAAPLEMERLHTVHYLGSKPYSEMPAYASEFDVCVLPWVTDNEFVNYGSAIKVREYLATGKPVVITPLYEYEPLDGILRIARNYDDFICKVEEALTADNDTDRAARQAAVRDSTWDARAEMVSQTIQSLLPDTSPNRRKS